MKQRMRPQMYATRPFSIIVSIIIYIGVFLILDRTKGSVPSWLWVTGLPILAVGIMLQMLSTRVLWIRSYQCLAFFLAGLVHTFAFGLILKDVENQLPTQFLYLVLATGYCISIGGAYYTTRKNSVKQLRVMPHGTIGTISPNTGIIRTEITSELLKKREERYSENLNRMKRFIPLLAGLAFYVLAVFGTAGNMAIVILISSVLAVTCAIGTGILAVYAVATYQWEREQQLQLHLDI